MMDVCDITSSILAFEIKRLKSVVLLFRLGKVAEYGKMIAN